MKSCILVLTVLAALCFTGCGGGTMSSSSNTTTYTISATVAGLNGTVVLEDSLNDTLTFTTDTTQIFAKSFASGTSYTVRVNTQPSGQTCILGSNASGTITSNITVAVTCGTAFTISASVTGLASGQTLGLTDNLGDPLSFTSNTTQTFATSYASGTSYTVSVAIQPTGQTCTLGSNASGTITSNITVAVTCASVATYTISAAVTGLAAGTTLDLTDNLSDQLSFTSNTTQTFPTAYQSGAIYTVSVAIQPVGQTCTLSSNATGTITSSITVTATCAANTSGPFSISVAVTGLASGATLAMQDNNGTGNELQFTTNTTETFLGTYVSGSSYTVSVFTQPANQNCTLSSNATGTITSNITVTATCVSAFTLSASVTGLASGATLKLQDNNTTGNQLTFTSNATQAFAATYVSGASYSVTVFAQPTGQTCTLASNANGIITANITVAVTCTSGSPSFTISAAVTGLASGATLTLLDNASDVLTFTSNTTLPFATAYVSGTSYTVSVATQPTGQTCALSSNATGTITANITVTATCTTSSTFTISATVTGLASGATLVLEDAPTDQLTFTSNTTKTFADTYSSGQSYAVTVVTQPTGQTCTLSSNASGTITSNITVTATCTSTATFTISAKVTGLASGATLVLEDAPTDQLTFTSNTTKTFVDKYSSGQSYTVSIVTQPTGQTCTLGSNASGTITSNITVTATCSTITFTISVTASGLSGTLKVQDDVGDKLTFTTNNTQTFATHYASGSTYSVSITTQPTGQTCTLSSNATGTITSNITVTATCATTFTISVKTTGLASGATLVLEDAPTDQLTFTSNTTKTFADTYSSGQSYAVTVVTQPTGQTCTLSSNSSGTITSNITVTATCASTATFTISAKVTGLASGATLVLEDAPTDQLTFTSNTTKTFADTYTSGQSYAVSIVTQPTGQTCTLSSNASGTITSNITVTATCTSSGGGLTVSVSVSGLSGTVVLQDDQGDTLTFKSNGTQTFANTYSSGATYTVSVTSQPSAQACIPTYSTGTITSNLTIAATCATGATRQLGTVSGVKSVSCQGSIKNGVCDQLTVSCPAVANYTAFVKINTPANPVGTITFGTGTGGNGLYESLFGTNGTAIINDMLSANYRTVQISFGGPFLLTEPNGWPTGTGGVLATACRYATITQWIYDTVQNDTSIPLCATANSGGAGALAYALSQYGSNSVLSMAEVTSGPPTGRLDWGCGCLEGSLSVQCGSKNPMGTCFGTADAPVWDPAYSPSSNPAVCTDAVNGTLPAGGLNFFLGDSVEAPGALYNFPHTWVNLVFGGADDSSAIPIGQDWFDNITSTSLTGQACVAGAPHSLPSDPNGAAQIESDLLSLCKLH